AAKPTTAGRANQCLRSGWVVRGRIQYPPVVPVMPSGHYVGWAEFGEARRDQPRRHRVATAGLAELGPPHQATSLLCWVCRLGPRAGAEATSAARRSARTAPRTPPRPGRPITAPSGRGRPDTPRPCRTPYPAP